MIHKIFIIFIFIFASTLVFAQKKGIQIEAKNKPLNLVLVELRDQYNIQFSYSDNELSKHPITISKSFQTADEAISFLLKDLPLKLKKTDEVFIIIPDKRKEKKAGKALPQTRITGQIVEAGSYEPLPFSHILINNYQMVSDVMGSFNYIASADSSFHVRISHLGYYVYDTILFAGINKKFTLIPSIKDLPEVTVHNNVIEKATLIGEKSGKMKLNHNISRFLPGQGDNSVFNLLRLMPGIQAAGEQSTDLLIWGSYEGQSQITFDEFTLFGLKNYNDNISVVNPFLVKNIEIFKGGYEAKYGNRVGGIVNITGKNGTLQKPTFSFNINPTTINGLLEIPLFKKSSFMVAYRQTYYNLYNPDDFNIFAPTRPVPKNSSAEMKAKNITFDLNVYPEDYQFRDLNLKYSFQSLKGAMFYISLYGGGDNFNLETNASLERESKAKNGMKRNIPFELTINNTEENKQNGLSVYYGKTWDSGFSSSLILSHSKLTKSITDNLSSKNLQNDNIYNYDRSKTQNTALENTLRLQNTIPLSNGNQFEFGGGLVVNEASIGTLTNLKDTVNVDIQTDFINNRAYLYLQDNFNLGSRLKIKTGVRLNYQRGINQYFFEPRLSGTYQLTEDLKMNASWGIFNQFMYKLANVDQDNNYTYLWVTGNDKNPALRGMHWIGGINYFKNNFTVNVETYYKTTQNIIRRVFETKTVGRREISGYHIYQGMAKSAGLDVYLKKDVGHHSIWASYSLSKNIESFTNNTIEPRTYQLAPHDQRHEFKVAGLFNVRQFYVSGNYVYGSGMQILREVFEGENVSYSRFDAAFTYHFTAKKFSGETGLSILNVFDTQNLKYANLKNIFVHKDVGSIKLYSDAVPFTPILFIKVVF